MNSQNKNIVIDADAHVVECAHTWDFMDKSEEKYRPIEVGSSRVDLQACKLEYSIVSPK